MSAVDMKRDLARFTDGIRRLKSTLHGSLAALQADAVSRQNDLDRMLGEHFEIREQAGKKLYCPRTSASGAEVVHNHLLIHGRLLAQRKILERAQGSMAVLPPLLFLNLTQLHETYIESLIESVLSLRPDLVKGWIGANQALDIPPDSGRAASERAPAPGTGSPLDRGLDAITAWLDAHLETRSRASISISPDLVEAVERGRLYACNGGMVSKEYLEACNIHNISLQGVHVGDQLDVTPEYFGKAADLICSAGVKLGHLSWRKLIPDQLSRANASLQDLTFMLIQEEQFGLAGELLDFANTALLDDCDENNRLVFLINGALNAYLLNDRIKCQQMLGMAQWPSSSEVLNLAHAALTERFDAASALMRRIGGHGRPNKTEYLRWPLFREFRKTPEFSSAFEEIFGSITLTEKEVS